MLVFDIETGALPLEEIKESLPPFDPNSIGKHPGEFNPDDVKLGRMTDQSKIDAKIEAEREKHEKSVLAYERKQETAEVDHWNAILDKAALHPVTGQVVAIGYLGKKEELHLAIDGVHERALLSNFWKIYKLMRKSNRGMVGFNIKEFDVPFLARRSWTLGVEVPSTILTPTGYLDQSFVDLRARWMCGIRYGEPSGYGTLDTVTKACGLPSKSEGMTGAEFAQKLWSDDESDREAAKQYLSDDLAATAALAERLGVS